jgi:hypothetical protein
MGGRHDSENQVLHFFRKRSVCHRRSGISVLRSGDPGIHVMLSQSLIALKLIAVIVAVYVVMIKTP